MTLKWCIQGGSASGGSATPQSDMVNEDMVNERAVRILLECILVFYYLHMQAFNTKLPFLCISKKNSNAYIKIQLMMKYNRSKWDSD